MTPAERLAKRARDLKRALGEGEVGNEAARRAGQAILADAAALGGPARGTGARVFGSANALAGRIERVDPMFGEAQKQTATLKAVLAALEKLVANDRTSQTLTVVNSLSN
jgi:hypothetical protein